MLQENPPREDPRVTRTRALVEKAFYELLMEKSLHALTIGDITNRARINRATFYAHFEDKYALYRHMVRNTFQQIFLKTLDGRWDDREAQLRAVVRAACLFFRSSTPPARRRIDARARWSRWRCSSRSKRICCVGCNKRSSAGQRCRFRLR